MLFIILVIKKPFTKIYVLQMIVNLNDSRVQNQEIFPNVNGHYEVEWDGLNYFQVLGQLSHLK